MIEIKNLTKKYGVNKGNFDISFSINDGEIFGIIGPNGAGKTTLIRQILGFVTQDSGEVLINGLKPGHDQIEIMKSMGYIAGEISLYDQLTGLEFLKMTADLKENVEWSYVETLLSHFELNPETRIKKMSKGMKQKIAIISAVMNKPKILILDEPTSGLDPLMQERFNELMNIFKEKYHSTIIICSHIFEEVTELCDNIIFVKKGKVIAQNAVKNKSVEEIKEQFKILYEQKTENL